MKTKRIIENILLTFFFLLVVAYPWAMKLLGVENDLSGVEEKVELSFENLDDYIIQNFPGRALLVRAKNQLLYSLFDISPNDSIVKVGDTLFSVETIDYYYHNVHSVSDYDVKVLINKLKKLNKICENKGKHLLIVLTPTKPRYYKGELPFADDVIMMHETNDNYADDTEKILPYDKLAKVLRLSKLNYFDTIKYIDNHKDELLGGEIPLFYNSGHHWSVYKSSLIGLELGKYMRRTMNVNLPDMTIKATASDVPVHPDSDLFDVLNIYDKPNEKFYKPIITYNNFNNEDLNFTIQGGSFLGGLLLPQTTISVNGEICHIENKNFFYNKYKDYCSFESYDELNEKYDLLNHIKKTDVIILEINEINVYNATFGFLDYLLSHEEEI